MYKKSQSVKENFHNFTVFLMAIFTALLRTFFCAPGRKRPWPSARCPEAARGPDDFHDAA